MGQQEKSTDMLPYIILAEKEKPAAVSAAFIP